MFRIVTNLVRSFLCSTSLSRILQPTAPSQPTISNIAPSGPSFVQQVNHHRPSLSLIISVSFSNLIKLMSDDHPSSRNTHHRSQHISCDHPPVIPARTTIASLLPSTSTPSPPFPIPPPPLSSRTPAPTLSTAPTSVHSHFLFTSLLGDL